jgi:hypothetical protein
VTVDIYFNYSKDTLNEVYYFRNIIIRIIGLLSISIMQSLCLEFINAHIFGLISIYINCRYLNLNIYISIKNNVLLIFIQKKI